jgi:molybdopterin synthase sulfur carrier subunit
MPITVRIPTPLRKLTANQDEVKVEGANVGEVLKNLEAAHPGIGERLLDPANGSIRKFVNIYVNDEDVRFLQNTETALKDGDEVSIIPAIAGGR